jgi:hypothetical protein
MPKQHGKVTSPPTTPTTKSMELSSESCGSPELSTQHLAQSSEIADHRLTTETIEPSTKGAEFAVDILTAQATKLNSLFEFFLNAGAELYTLGSNPTPVYKLALKAQSQCRAALATISFIENPQTVSFIKQQNIGYQQQINNDLPLNNINSHSEVQGIE